MFISLTDWWVTMSTDPDKSEIEEVEFEDVGVDQVEIEEVEDDVEAAALYQHYCDAKM